MSLLCTSCQYACDSPCTSSTLIPTLHAPATQVWFIAQTVPQPPQLLRSVLRLASPRLAWAPYTFAQPPRWSTAGSVGDQHSSSGYRSRLARERRRGPTPSMPAPPPARYLPKPGQAMAQWPQFFGSVLTLISQPLGYW